VSVRNSEQLVSSRSVNPASCASSRSPLRNHVVSESASYLASRLVEDMAARWRDGERPLTEEFLADHPQLRDDPEGAIALVYEEFCLRQELREEAGAQQFLLRFPQFREQLEVLLGFHKILEPSAVPAVFPSVGDVMGDFRLLAELGRGAQGRVFLATQPQLADRPVVLKLTPSSGFEHISLARVQHTNIMPLYSMQDDLERGLRALCMPYFGGTTLARVLDLLADRPVELRTGQNILDVLAQVQAAAPVSAPARGLAMQFFAHASYVQAICWVGACLADALHHAHERGLLHLDLKPSNVLLMCDGLPMLLDFHLAREPIQHGEAAAEWLGGTAGYMSPEQQLALAAVRSGRTIQVAVDARSDVYSLGLLLYESLGGKLPLPACGTPPRLDKCNPQVSEGLSDLIAKCLEHDPDDRYLTAGTLGADLRRHLSDLPLRGVRNRCLIERWRKWRRRRPHTLVLASMAIALVIAIVAAGTIAITNARRRVDEACSALTEGEDHLEKRHYTESVDAFKRGISLSETILARGDLKEKLYRQLHQAEQFQVANDLHMLADQVRFAYAAEFPTTETMRALEARCRTLWEKHELITARLEPQTTESFRRNVETDLLDLAILWADLHVRVASANEADQARREAIDLLDQAERVFGPSAVLSHERHSYSEALKLPETTQPAPEQSFELAPRSAWEYYALGRSLLAQGDLEKASQLFEHSVELQPEGLWPNFYQGTCAYRRERYAEAVIAFTACVVAMPDSAGCFYDRALAYAALGRSDRALQDYSHALKLDPTLAVAALNRAILYYREKRYTDAADDLERALKNGANPASVYYHLALVHLAQGDRAAALSDSQRALEHDPSHQDARILRSRISPERK
jgi:eukaryotic-like serine/threonine-protein kinase